MMNNSLIEKLGKWIKLFIFESNILIQSQIDLPKTIFITLFQNIIQAHIKKQ